ncbi:polyhydroxyalkanoate synthase [Antricoccus suffuscus]|uniref:Polyhydroxyalkanoate synthase n=1 Tax=Antricoccus suffuscus TaxID=1629062 RepID=A0A2T1A784_9ACTN|nr:alpha/beta fold hydrolase [Antricoccus suffuscus]PRZ44414.1 polyhydroxyalkanoate synthase [Antricoccus suffuscus]
MARTLSPGEIIAGIKREVETAALRARNGIQYLALDKSEGLQPTPRTLVASRDKVTLWRYASPNKRYDEPILVFLGLVSRSYVLDLLPGKSYINSLCEAGFDVYLLDWGQPDAAESENTLETYVDFYLPRALKIVQRESGCKDVNVIGYCFGAILALMYQASRGNSPISSMVLMAAPVDFRHMHVHTGPLRDGMLNPDDVINDEGFVPADVVRRSLSVRAPTYDIAQYVNLWDKLASKPDSGALEAHAVMTNWVRDHVNFPGAAFRQFVTMFLQDNGFVNGTARAGDKKIDLSRIDIPVLSVIAERDDLIPPKVSFPLRNLMNEELYDEVLLKAGHVGLVLGGTAQRVTIPAIAEFLQRNSTSMAEETA